MDTRKLNSPDKKEAKIDCNSFCTIFTKIKKTTQDSYVLLFTYKEKKVTIKFDYPTLDVHGDKGKLDKLLLDVRTFLCSQNKCLLHHTRSHQRMTNYNMRKIRKFKNAKYIKTIEIIAGNIEQILISTEEIKKTYLSAVNNHIINNTTSKSSNNTELKENCPYCLNPKTSGTKHIHFIRSVNEPILQEKPTKKYEPIERVFDSIDKIAEENNLRLSYKSELNTVENNVTSNKIRMTYGDINYLGSNKAIFYFDRGSRGKQIFTNSMYPLKNQPKYKDLVVIDEIVFTSNCKCDSSKQHKKMFPHYRVTCAVGLTCPAKLNKHQRLLYARNRNAATETPTTARSMLIRYWC
jgi:hypothetical protein